MKRALFWLLAVAIVVQYGADPGLVGSNYILPATIIYVGNDVPGTIRTIQTDLAIPTTVTSSTLQSSIATAVRSNATSLGLTVPAGNVWMTAWTTL